MLESIRQKLSLHRWWGKVIGAGLGFAVRPGVVGALVGGIIGHQFDRGVVAGLLGGGTSADGAVGELFFATTFAVMGHVAKSDGRVSASEIEVARVYMQRFDLTEAQKREAIRLFTDGKRADFPLDDTLARFRRACRGQKRLIDQFVEIQVEAMLADNRAHPNTRNMLWAICQRLGVSRVELAHMETAARARRGGVVGGNLIEAYKVLGVDPKDDDKTVKNAYRRLMNRHHPDKLAAKGLPKELMTQAREQTQAIQAAYETVKANRDLN